jgi:hypothetical protein
MPRLRSVSLPRVSETDQPRQRIPDAGKFKKGRAKSGGRAKGQSNLISADTRREILRGIAMYGSDGKGTDGVAGAVYAACADNLRNAVSLLCAIVPREVAATITRHEVNYTTIAELDEDLLRHGLPPTAEIFRLDFKGTSAPAEPVVEEEILPLK